MKRSISLAVAAVCGSSGLLFTGQPATAEASVYNQPGDHLVNGRYWKTSCEKYSAKVVRCRTQIWATKVVKHGGKYVQHNGWVFNNLTYLPSDRSRWAKNPLAKTGTWTKDGRQWRTECDTANTGRNTCRSYIMGSVLEKKGGRYHWTKKWVFNNMVQFAHSGAPAVTSIPAAAPKLANVPVERPLKATAHVAKAAAQSAPGSSSSSASARQKVVNAAMSKVGSSYRHGASGPNAFDCSGLTSYAYRQVGVNLKRSSRAQATQGRSIPKSQLQPGDLVFFYSPISHVAIYIGDGKVVHAGNKRTGVNVIKMSHMPFAKAVRIL